MRFLETPPGLISTKVVSLMESEDTGHDEIQSGFVGVPLGIRVHLGTIGKLKIVVAG